MLVVCGFAEQSVHIPKLFSCSQASSAFVDEVTGCDRFAGRCSTIGKHIDKLWFLAYTQQEEKKSDRF